MYWVLQSLDFQESIIMVTESLVSDILEQLSSYKSCFCFRFWSVSYQIDQMDLCLIELTR